MAVRFPAENQILASYIQQATGGLTPSHFSVSGDIVDVTATNTGSVSLDVTQMVSPGIFYINELMLVYSAAPAIQQTDTEIVDIRIYEDAALTSTRFEFLNYNMSGGMVLLPVNQVFANTDSPQVSVLYVAVTNKNTGGTPRSYTVEVRCRR